MVGVRTRYRALRQSEMVFKTRFMADQGSDKPKPRMNRNGIRRVTTMKKITDNVQKQSQKSTRKSGGEAMSSTTTQSETVCETNSE